MRIGDYIRLSNEYLMKLKEAGFDNLFYVVDPITKLKVRDKFREEGEIINITVDKFGWTWYIIEWENGMKETFFSDDVEFVD